MPVMTIVMNIEKLLKVSGGLEKVYPVLGVKDLYSVEAKYSHYAF
jgi:hypothetical protein